MHFSLKLVAEAIVLKGMNSLLLWLSARLIKAGNALRSGAGLTLELCIVLPDRDAEETQQYTE